jgi:predicted ester cyclase
MPSKGGGRSPTGAGSGTKPVRRTSSLISVASPSQFNAELFSGFPHLQQEITGIIATATDVIYRHRLTGTHDGVLLGLPATGKPVDISGMTWLRISGGRIVEQWYELNHAELQRQLAVTA